MAIAHRRIGTGPVRVIVLHDWFGTSANWGSVLDYLDPEEFSYAFLDYRGYGERRDVSGRHTLAEIADDVLELADQLGWDTFSLLGHSMGGKAIQQVLVRAPERVEKLIGLTPPRTRWTTRPTRSSTAPPRTPPSAAPSSTWSPATARAATGSTTWSSTP
ncbi:alpha/beta fold hydrolase [Streptomyces sp. NPDC058746]|uniref:alpha/beta fold hydrolase n=1 Tax=Streptomyces sp. NPDC058746 TaxID=3346622 RepID=UPI0036C0EA50